MAEDAAALWDAVARARRDAVRASARATRCGSRSATRCTATTSARRPTRSPPGLGWVCALDKDFTGAEELRRIKADGPERASSSPFVMEERAIPRQGMAIAEGGEVTSGPHSPMLDEGIGMGYVASRARRARARASRSTSAAATARADVVKKPIYKREED